jgi:hypothetical protein
MGLSPFLREEMGTWSSGLEGLTGGRCSFAIGGGEAGGAAITSVSMGDSQKILPARADTKSKSHARRAAASDVVEHHTAQATL